MKAWKIEEVQVLKYNENVAGSMDVMKPSRNILARKQSSGFSGKTDCEYSAADMNDNFVPFKSNEGHDADRKQLRRCCSFLIFDGINNGRIWDVGWEMMRESEKKGKVR